MHEILEKIIDKKKRDVENLYQRILHPTDNYTMKLKKLLNSKKTEIAQKKSFSCALGNNALSVIAEIKRRSPSKGEIAKISNPASRALRYKKAGASALSILTEDSYFGGSQEDFKIVHQAVNIPLLRKDFIIDPYQVYEARAMHADCILLIVSALDDAMLNELLCFLFIVCPKPDNFNSMFFFIYLIDKPMLNINSTRICT